MAVIPAPRRLRDHDCYKFNASLGCRETPSLKNKKINFTRLLVCAVIHASCERFKQESSLALQRNT